MKATRRALIAALPIYALALFTATHWPGITIQGPVVRSDLWIHAAAYCLLTLLTLAALATRRSLTRAALRWTCLGLLALAGADELTQPLSGRIAALSDWVADSVGIMLAGVIASLIRDVSHRNPRFLGMSLPKVPRDRPSDLTSGPAGVTPASQTTDEPTHGPRPKNLRVRA